MTKKKPQPTSSGLSSTNLSEPEGEADVRACAEEIEQVLARHNMGLQPVLQLFKLPPKNTKSNSIVLAGGNGDIPPAIVEMLKPIGDDFTK